MYFFYFLYKIPKNIYKDRSRTGLGTDLYTVLGPSNGPVQSSPGQKTGLLGPGPDRTGPIHLYFQFFDTLRNFFIKLFFTILINNMRGRKPFRIPQIPKRRTLSSATGHNRDRYRSRSRSRKVPVAKFHEEVDLVKSQNTVQVIMVGNQEE